MVLDVVLRDACDHMNILLLPLVLFSTALAPAVIARTPRIEARFIHLEDLSPCQFGSEGQPRTSGAFPFFLAICGSCCRGASSCG